MSISSDEEQTQPFQSKQRPEFQFGTTILKACTDSGKKFKTLSGITVNDEQQCLLDNFWHIQTVPTATTFKVQLINALSFYFTQHQPSQQFAKKFTHYVIYRGTKTGLFNSFETVRKFVMCPSPIYKGYYSFKEAFNAARQDLGLNFYIEPEEVKSFSETVQQNPTEIFKAQSDKIAKLEAQLLETQKLIHSLTNQFQASESKNKHLSIINTNLQETVNRQHKIIKMEKQIEEMSKQRNRSFDQFKCRILDLPLTEALYPLLDSFPQFNDLVAHKSEVEFVTVLENLQLELLDIHFTDKYKGVTVIQTFKQQVEYDSTKNKYSGGIPGLLKLQIDLNNTDMEFDKIAQLFYYGMIDLISFRINRQVTDFLEKLGEKVFLIAGNICSHSSKGKVFCKIYSTLPEIVKGTYVPSRKRIIIDDRDKLHHVEQKVYDIENISDPDIYTFHQKPENIERFLWRDYRLFGEGHYVQVWSTPNWQIILPFSGLAESFEEEDIYNTSCEDREVPSCSYFQDSEPETD